MRRRNLILSVILVLALLAPAFARDISAAGKAEAGNPAKKVSRWESNLSAGAVLQEQIGIVKSFWWYALPKIFALGLSFDFVGATLPISLNVSLNLPLPVVVPFVCAGAGTSVSRGGITNYGGGLKFRIWPKIGILVEYRKYSRKPDPLVDPPGATRVKRDYIGAGIAYIY
jgi:hypothetical protein